MELLITLLSPTGELLFGEAANTGIKLRRVADDFLFDWDDLTFKASGWTTIEDVMVEVDATNLPGRYNKTIDISGFTNGRYYAFMSYDDGNQFSEEEFLVFSGLMFEEFVASTISGYIGGTGDTLVNEDTGGVDNMRYVDQTASGIDDAVITAYLTSDYDAGDTGSTFIKGISRTKADGRWSSAIYLDSGFDYTITFYKATEYSVSVKEITI